MRKTLPHLPRYHLHRQEFMTKKIALFAYEFPHRKTSDFILEALACGFRDIVVLAAGKKILKHQDKTKYFETSLLHCPPISSPKLCAQLNIPFYLVEHDDLEKISEIIKNHSIDTGIIAGARIIKSNIIDLFKNGIVNFHPGKIPETSGLDSFFYTLINNVAAGVTTHFIDHRVDAGKMVFFDEATTSASATPETIIENVYQLQIVALRRVLSMLRAGEIQSEDIDRPAKNAPMKSEEKVTALSHFPRWRASQVLIQAKTQLFNAIESGNFLIVKNIINEFPNFIFETNNRGWTPLITAAFENNAQIVNFLLQSGANPNACGLKGTTVLMYAKTKLLNKKYATYELLDLLIANGADVARTDCFGKNVLDYVRDSGDKKMYEFFQKVSN